MNRAFTKDEKVLLVLCIVLIFAISYYQFVWKSTNKIIEQYDIAMIEDELFNAQLKAIKIKEMEKYIDEHKDQAIGRVADYNNLQNEIIELNEILSEALTYKLDFEDATTDNKIVRRNVNITFQTKSYSAAKEIIESLKNSRYKSLLRDIDILAKENGLQSTGLVDVKLKVTFYEGITEAVAHAGLQEYIHKESSTK